MNDDAVIDFILYVAGDLPNSRRAAANLQAFCRLRLSGMHNIEIRDVFDDPEKALADRILLTPQLIVVRGEARHVVIGDLADQGVLCQAADVSDGEQ